MSNKSQLQLNNTDLQSILSTVLGLPTQESVKHGTYVWKKCKTKSPIGIANLSASGTSTVITLESSEGVTEETLDGAVFTVTQIGGTYSCTFTLSYANGSKKFSSTDVYGGNYSYSNGVITLNTTVAFTSSQFNASDITFPDSKPEFIDFVVSDSESAYPDGGTQDGYWYEKVVEGIDLLSATNYSNIAVDKFTLSSTLSGATKQINHSLGEIPKIAIILSPLNDSNTLKVEVLGYYSNKYTQYMKMGLNNTNMQATKGQLSVGMNAETVPIYGDASSYYYQYMAGVEYTLITMA